MKVFEVMLKTYSTVLMEATDEKEARECAKCRWGREIIKAEHYEIEISESPVSRDDPRVLVS